MSRIRTQWGAAIQTACKFSSVPEEFLAALIANESGGNVAAKRFEPSIYGKLLRIHQGAPEHYGPLTAEILRSVPEDTLHNWATSWGLTQVMGYHIARRPGGIELLKNPETHLKFALGLLGEFVQGYQLNPRQEFEEMFRCWNTGAPYDNPKTSRIEGRTSDPQYVARGLARMKVYAEILKGRE